MAYEIGSFTKRFSDTGAFIVHAGVVNEQAEYALRIIFKELKKVRNDLVRRDEFKRAKLYYRGQLLMGLESPLEHMAWIGESVMTKNQVKSAAKIIQEIEDVKIEDVRKVAKMIFKKESLNVSIIGPLSKGKQKAEDVEQW